MFIWTIMTVQEREYSCYPRAVLEEMKDKHQGVIEIVIKPVQITQLTPLFWNSLSQTSIILTCQCAYLQIPYRIVLPTQIYNCDQYIYMVRYSTVTSTIRRNFCSNLFHASATKQVSNATCREKSVYLTCTLQLRDSWRGLGQELGSGNWSRAHWVGVGGLVPDFSYFVSLHFSLIIAISFTFWNNVFLFPPYKPSYVLPQGPQYINRTCSVCNTIC